MAYKTVATIVTDAKADKSALDAAVKLTRHEDGHLDVYCLGLDRTVPGFYYAGANAVILQDNVEKAAKDAELVKEDVTKHLDGEDIRWAATPVSAQMAGLTPFVAHRARFSDIAVLPRPYGDKRSYENEEIVEAALFNAKVPVLVIPPKKALPDNLGTVVLAWNESAEALAAVRASLPLLIAADKVSITVIDPPHHGPDRSDPGGAISELLARHGARCEVSVLSKTMPRVSDVLCRHAADVNADLVVMGAYGHSRFRESIMGGATRNMLEACELPILMAH